MVAAKGEPAYGINTGFGRLASTHIPHDQLELLQRKLVLSHAVGVGEPDGVPFAGSDAAEGLVAQPGYTPHQSAGGCEEVRCGRSTRR